MFVKLLMSWALTRRSYVGRHRFPRNDQGHRAADDSETQRIPPSA